MMQLIRRAGAGRKGATEAGALLSAGACAVLVWTVATPSPSAGADLPAAVAQPAAADDPLAADLKTIADSDAAEDEAREAAVRLNESLDGPLPDVTMAALLRQVAYPDERVRRRAISLLGTIGPSAEAAVPELVRIARDAKPDAHGFSDATPAGLALGRIGRRPDLALPVMTAALSAAGPDHRSAAAFAIGGFGPAAAPAIPDLVRRMDDPDPGPRVGAAHALGKIGPAARPAGPKLLARLDRLKDAAGRHDAEERRTVAEALGRIGDPPAAGPLAALLAADDASDRATAAYALGRIGPAAAAAGLPALEKSGRESELRDRPELRVPVAFALVRLGRADDGLARLAALANDDAATRDVFVALTELGPPAVPVLSAVIRSDSKNGRWAVQAVEEMGPAGKAAVPALVDVVKAGRGKGPQRFKFDESLVALGKLGPDARDAAPVLREVIATSKSDAVSAAATKALRRVEAAPRPATRPAERR